MKTPFYPNQSPPGRPAPPESSREIDSLDSDPDWRVANSLPAEEQLERFALWLRVTDGGHQPC